MPAPYGGDDFVGIGCAYERLGLLIELVEEAVDGGLKIGEGSKTPRFSLRFVRVGKKPSTVLSREADVGAKWNVQRGWRWSRWGTLGCL